MLLVDKLDFELTLEAERLKGKPKDKVRKNLAGGYNRGSFPDLNEIEFLILYTERVGTYFGVINNDLNKEKKKKKTIKTLKNVYNLIT